MRTVAVIFCSLLDLPGVIAAGLGQTAPSPTPPTPEPVKPPEPTAATVAQQQPEPPKTEEPPPAVTNTAPPPTEEPPKRRTRSQEKPATDPKTPAEALVPPPRPLGDPPPRQDSFAIGEEKPVERPLRQRSGPSVRLPSGIPSIDFDEIPENP
jgi:hypothetical protein